MAYTGKITITSQQVSVVIEDSFSTTTARDNWLDTFDLTTRISAGNINGANLLISCSKGENILNTDVPDGYVLLAPDATTALAKDRTLRRGPAPIVLINGGQSSAVGYGPLADRPGGYPANPGKITNFSNAYIFRTPATDPIDDNTNQVDAVSSDTNTAVGQCLAMADTITQSRSNQVVIVPCARSGTNATSWVRGGNPIDRTTLYGSMQYRAQQVCSLLRIPTSSVVLVWFQGQSDSQVVNDANNWQTRTATMLSNFRSDLGVANMPVFVVRLHPTVPTPNGSYPGWTTIRNAAPNLADSNTFVVDCPDGPWVDQVSWDLATSTQIALGNALGASYLSHF